MQELKCNSTKLSFNEFVRNTYNYTLINSLLFTEDLRRNINEYINVDEETAYDVFCDIEKWMLKNCGSCFFDKILKDNLYYLSNYVLEIDNSLTREEKIEKINEVKRYINRCFDFRPYYIREQIVLRCYNFSDDIVNFKTARLNKVDDSIIIGVRDLVYKSISFDIDFLDMFYVDKNEFYTSEYKEYLMQDKFYMSLNYYLQNYPRLFTNKEYLNRIKYIISNSIEKNIPYELKNLINSSKKLVKQFEKGK